MIALRKVALLLGISAGLLSGLPNAQPAGAQEQEGLGTIRGLALDSTTMAPLAGATVSLAGGAGRIQTDSTGAFRFEEVPPGEYPIVVSHPRIDSLGLTPILRMVTVAPGDSEVVVFATPSLASLRGIHCEGEPTPLIGRDGIVVGIVQDELTGVPQSIATVVAE